MSDKYRRNNVYYFRNFNRNNQRNFNTNRKRGMAFKEEDIKNK